MQRIVYNNHVWEVPNEPGWEEVIESAAPIQKLLHHCTTASECHRIVNQLYEIFNRFPVSRKYLESNGNDNEDMISSIFKWG